MTTFDILTERNNLTVTENEEIKLNPISRFEFITYPLRDDLKTLIIDKDTYYGLLLKVYQFNVNLDGVELFDSATFKQFMKEKFEASKAMKAVK